MRLAIPVAGFISQWPWSTGFSQFVRPRWFVSGSAGAALFAGAAADDLAQATWREPGPWQDSQETFPSLQVLV